MMLYLAADSESEIFTISIPYSETQNKNQDDSFKYTTPVNKIQQCEFLAYISNTPYVARIRSNTCSQNNVVMKFYGVSFVIMHEKLQWKNLQLTAL